MAIPPNIQARLAQLKQEAAMRAEMERRRAQAQQNAQQSAKALEGKAKGGKVLPKEEYDENLRQFLDTSKVKDRLYHITPSSFGEFKPGGDDPKRSGHAVWLTPDTSHLPAAHRISYRDEQGKTYPISGPHAKYREGTNVMPVHVQAKNPMILDDPDMLKWAQAVYANGSAEFPYVMPKEWADEVRKDYDAIVLADPHKRGDTHEVIMFEPNKIKSAIGNRGTFDTKHKDITKAKGGEVAPTQDEMRLALTKHGTYSPLEKAMMAVPRTKGMPSEFMAEASKQPGFRAEEVADRRVQLPQQKMSKAEMLAHLQSHPSPQIEETVIGGAESVPENVKSLAYTMLYDSARNSVRSNNRHMRPELIEAEAQKLGDKWAKEGVELPYFIEAAAQELGVPFEQTGYSDYQLPGGQNYREILLKLPDLSTAARENLRVFQNQMKEKYGRLDWRRAAGADDQLEHDRLLNEEKKQAYRSSHWEGHPNVLAHVRASDRTGPNGEKILHLEEIQSDWHQEGRKKGYKGKNITPDEIDLKFVEPNVPEGHDPSLYPGYYESYDKNTGRMIGRHSGTIQPDEAIKDALYVANEMKTGVPDAPFKKSWHEAALKHMLHHAVKGGYHGIAITPGEEQANRYDLSKHIDSISYDPEIQKLEAWDKNRKKVLGEFGVDPSGVEHYVGKDVAKRLFETNLVMGKHLLEGQGLEVGGEGMKGFYDKIIPDFLNKLGKKHGAKVGSMKIQAGTEPLRNAEGDMTYVKMPVQKDVHYFPIPDTMRQQIQTEGLPQYERGGIIHKAEGGSMQPTLAQMKAQLGGRANPIDIRSIGVNEAVNLDPKVYMPPNPGDGMPAPGGVATPSGMPVGGIDVNQGQPGKQLMPQSGLQPQGGPQQPPGAPGASGAPAGGLPGGAPQGMPGAGGQPPMGPASNILQMTPQGQTLAALGGVQQPQAKMAKGGTAKTPSVEQMKKELAENKDSTSKRMKIEAEGPGGVKGIVVPKHMWHGTAHAEGMKHLNEARAQVYGSENRDPLSIGKVGAIHKQTLAEHFKKPEEQQRADEQAALERLRAAKHIGKTANTLDESEKLDTVRHEHDQNGRTYVGYASKGTAGHALYTSGHGDNMKHHVINTCPGQTTGCGGGVDKHGVVDTKKGTCFAPNAESQYVNAAVRRAAHEQAKHDPAMTKDWILAHTGSLRHAAERADKKHQVTLFRPNVVDETDVSSRHVIRHLNEQRKAKELPGIVANSYGKTNELHDPENGYHVTHSNVGPKVKKGQEISENIGRDKARVRNTILAADNRGDFTNEQGHKTPPKGSYMVTDVKRGSKLSKDMEKAITHAKYWSAGRPVHELNDEEREEGPEAHYSGSGRKTTEDKAHYGHKTIGGERFDYQRQHILHPRLVQVGKNEDGSPHMIPTDSRFKDTDYLPKNRYKTKNGKEAGHILMTTPTESTSNLGHETSFTHHVSPKHVEHALKNNGEYDIDKPEDQIKARGKEYVAPQPVKFMAEGGHVGRHPGFGHDEFHAFPEQNPIAQRHLAMRRGDDESRNESRRTKKPVVIHKNLDTMQLELSKGMK